MEASPWFQIFKCLWYNETYLGVQVVQGGRRNLVVLEDQPESLPLYPSLLSPPRLPSDPSLLGALRGVGLRYKKRDSVSVLFRLACVMCITLSGLCYFTWLTCFSLRPRETCRLRGKPKVQETALWLDPRMVSMHISPHVFWTYESLLRPHLPFSPCNPGRPYGPGGPGVPEP